MRAGHVVGDGAQMAGFGQVQRALLVGDHVFAEEQAAIFHAMDVLGHLALAAAAGALVHEDQLVLIGRDDGNGRAMVGRPAFAFADVEEHGVDALLRARARIEVVGEDLLVRGGAVVHDNLAAAKMRMPERRRDKEHAAGDFEIRREPGCAESCPADRPGPRQKTRPGAAR